MELATEILKLKDNKEIDNKIISDMCDLNIFDYADSTSSNEFLLMIKSKKWIEPMSRFVGSIFYLRNQSDLPMALLFSFYLSTYGKKVFTNKFYTKFDKKILQYANNVVMLITTIMSTGKLEDPELYDTIDHYYSLYKIWISKELLQNMDNKLSEFKDKINTNTCTEMKLIIDDMFNLDQMLSIKVLLPIYNIFKLHDCIKVYFWKKIFDVYKTKPNHTFIMLVAELRKYIIQESNNAESRKCLYYGIDIDELTRKFRSSSITKENCANIMSILKSHYHLIEKHAHNNTQLNNKLKCADTETDLHNIEIGTNEKIDTSLGHTLNTILELKDMYDEIY